MERFSAENRSALCQVRGMTESVTHVVALLQRLSERPEGCAKQDDVPDQELSWYYGESRKSS